MNVRFRLLSSVLVLLLAAGLMPGCNEETNPTLGGDNATWTREIDRDLPLMINDVDQLDTGGMLLSGTDDASGQGWVMHLSELADVISWLPFDRPVLDVCPTPAGGYMVAVADSDSVAVVELDGNGFSVGRHALALGGNARMIRFRENNSVAGYVIGIADTAAASDRVTFHQLTLSGAPQHTWTSTQVAGGNIVSLAQSGDVIGSVINTMADEVYYVSISIGGGAITSTALAEWAGGFAASLRPLSADQFLVSGGILNTNGVHEIWLSALTRDGSQLWRFSEAGGTTGADDALPVQGGYFILATDNNPDNYQVKSLGLDSGRSILWERTYGGDSTADYGVAAFEQIDGYYLIVYESVIGGDRRLTVARVNSDGLFE